MRALHAISLQRLFLAAAALCALLAGVTDAHAATLVVDRDKAQCPHASYASIQHAVDAAEAGDTVKVCADRYPEEVTVDKPLTVHGETPADEAPEAETGATAGGDCFDQNAVDPTLQAIVDPDDGAFSIAFKLRADDIVLQGFVVQGASVGIDASDSFSGYRIHHNLIQHNTLFGIDFGSAGAHTSRVDHNCIRQNRFGLVSELDDDSLWQPADGPERDEWNQRDLRNARIDHNDSTQNGVGLDTAGPGKRVDVRLDHNRSRQDAFGIALQNSTGSAILDNEITAAPQGSILLGGGNEGLRIDANSIRGGLAGVRFDQGPFFDKFPLPSSHLVVSGNDIRNAVAGILSAAGNLSESLISGNITSDNTGNGIILLARNTNNVILANQAHRNRVAGISAFLGATGNRFEQNSMQGNGTDARDFNTPINIWIDNDCATDNQFGAICGAG